MDFEDELNKTEPHVDGRLWNKDQVLGLMRWSFNGGIEAVAAYTEFAEWPPYSKEQAVRVMRSLKA